MLVLALLGVIAASFLRETRTATLIARNLTENAKAEALADAGVERAMLGLLDADRKTAWRADGRSYELRLGEGIVRIRLEDEAGKIDVNRAPGRILQRLFVAVGIGDEEARALVDAILTARRQVSPEAGGDVATSVVSEGSERQPFDRLDGLSRLPGMRPDIVAQLAPYLTVYSGREQYDAAVAPPLLRQILPEAVASPAEADATDRVAGAGPSEGSIIVLVLAEAATATGGEFAREAVLQRTDDPAKPFRVLLWRQRWRSAGETP